MPGAPALQGGRDARARAPASRTRSGSAWTSAAATMPIRAGSCPCSAGAATSPRTRSARSASPPSETLFEIPRAAAARFAAALKRTAGGDADGEGGIRIEAVEGKPRDVARENRRSGPPPARHKAKPFRKGAKRGR